MTTLFWVFFFSVVYCYFLYPLVIYLLARLIPNPVRKSPIEPTVSVVISLHNEQDVIAAKLNNLLEADYPPEKLEILLGSDGSTDRTHEIIGQFNNPRIRLVVNAQRRGKMATLNGLIPLARHEIIFFTDARQIIDRGAIRELMSNFADPKIGCVSGELVFIKADGGTAQGVNLYWNYEKFIRFQEGCVHSILGATGAIYAIRKNLFEPGPADIVLDDMFTPFKIIQKGYRAVFDDSVHAYDRVAVNPKEEYRRKTRTLYGNYQIFVLFPGLLNPFQSPIAFQLFSHKLLRLLVPFFLIALFLINFVLRYEPVFGIFWALQVLFYSMALTAHLTGQYNKGLFKYIAKACYVPYVFCLLNYSALVGFWRFVSSTQQSTWQKAREI